MTLIRSIFALTLILFSTGFAAAQDRPLVVTVNYPLQYFAQRLVGDEADVVFPVPRGIDPSFWRPSIADISMIQSADLILLNGAGFATWIDRVTLPRSKVFNASAAFEDRFIRTQSITHSHGEGEEHSHESTASYIWMDPILAIAQAEAVAEAVVARAIAPADAVQQRMSALRSDLEALDDSYRAAFDELGDIAIIATHPRYQYFARRYGLTISSLEWEAGAMPTAAERANLRALVEQTGAQVIIWEAEPPVAAFAFASDLGLQNVVLSSLAHDVEGRSFIQVFEDALEELMSQ